MAIVSYAKAIAQSRDLADRLSKRYAGSATIDTVRQTTDSNGAPLIICSDGGTETAGSAVIAIRISPVGMVSPDVFGNTQSAFSPHVLEIAAELTATANKLFPTIADFAIASYEAMNCGIRTQLKQTANTVAVTAANMDATAATADIESLNWPNKSI